MTRPAKHRAAWSVGCRFAPADRHGRALDGMHGVNDAQPWQAHGCGQVAE